MPPINPKYTLLEKDDVEEKNIDLAPRVGCASPGTRRERRLEDRLAKKESKETESREVLSFLPAHHYKKAYLSFFFSE